MKRLLIVVPLLLAFAFCIARSAQARAADDVKASGCDKIVVCGVDDLVFTEAQRVSLEPPAVSTHDLPPPVESRSGRRVIAELFRPPITA